MINAIEKDGKKFVLAKELYNGLQLNTSQYSRWVKRHIIESKSKYKDYSTIVSNENGRGNFSNDYLLSLNFAKFLCTTSGSEVAIDFVEHLISLDNKKEEGLLLTHSDIVDLFAMVKAAFVDNFRELAKKKHIESYLPNNPQGYHYGKAQLQRNKVCGIDKKDLERRLNEVNIKYEKVQSALIQIDKYELIRIAIIDVMIHFGKTNEYAINVGNLAKELAKKESQSFTSSDNTLFPLPKEYNQIYLQLNK